MSGSLSILLVEDDVVDVMSTRRALAELNVSNPLSVAGNGEEALAHLQAAAVLPRLILLDLNMPRMNGVDTLRALKKDERLRRLPVVVLTTSKEDKDLAQCFELGAAGYMTKPVEYTDFVQTIRTIHQYWNLSESPPALPQA